MMIFGWLLIGLGIYYFMNNGKLEKVRCNNSKRPEDVLKERYVNGEIDEATYNKMKMTIDR
ncbi:SHOCT domain-containing protein [[Clostridium] fimetarium]|uniref:Short C-terminal domain-containing protein n=1 Tax=[Clostridium] fimetarium TaxID=99656 RepID=A0A1I0RR31_9FIRM|nr:hypothetical protein [[Clostridium] fimetarium]SEW43715.1 hypothetical protein SAMN05421659_12145 [[Clostridium] fimetarium]